MIVASSEPALSLLQFLIPADLALSAVLSRNPLSTLAQQLALDPRVEGQRGELQALEVFIAAGYEPSEAHQKVQQIIRDSWREDA